MACLRTILLALIALNWVLAQEKPMVLLDQAQDLLEQDRYEEAAAAATEAISLAPSDVRGYLMRGVIREQARLFALAIDDYTRAIDREKTRAGIYVRRGATRFFSGDINGSIADFDEVAKLEPDREPHLWQRGISYYYAGRYQDCAAQFARHQKVNPNDVENAVWHFLCVARSSNITEARKRLMPVQGDSRVPMAEIHRLYAGRGTAKDVLDKAGTDPEARMYAHLYLGLWEDVNGRKAQAHDYLTKAAKIAELPGHYMWEVARVHHARQSPGGQPAAPSASSVKPAADQAKPGEAKPAASSVAPQSAPVKPPAASSAKTPAPGASQAPPRSPAKPPQPGRVR